MLEPEALELIQASSGGKSRAEMDVAETRAAMLAGRRWQAPAPEVPVREDRVAGVPVRWYGGGLGPSAVFLHGGRFFSGDLDTHDAPLRMIHALSGVTLCAVDYRLAPEHPYPAAVDDAVAVARALGPSVIFGDSAGGYLAARASAHAGRALLIYPMLDPACNSKSYQEFWDGPWPNGFDMQRGWQLWGEAEAVTSIPPDSLIVTAGVDPLRDEAVALATRTGAAHVHFDGMHHGFFTQTVLSRSRELIELAAAWIKR